MTESELQLVKRFEHYLYDKSPKSYNMWYPDCDCFEDVWKTKVQFQRACPSPNWEQRCKDRGLVKFAPYTEAAIDLKLTIYGY